VAVSDNARHHRRVNDQWAMEQLRHFISISAWQPRKHPNGHGDNAGTHEELVQQGHVVVQILDRVVPGWNDAEQSSFDAWRVHRDAAHRALAQLERNQELRDNLCEDAPDLNAAHMHPWVWDGARSMWESRHYRGAVSAAAVKVNAETQNKVSRRDVSETKLFQEAFSSSQLSWANHVYV
jgi:hypothetical protein